MWKHLRTSIRLVRFGWIVVSCIASYMLTVWLRGRSASQASRAAWLSKHSRRTLAVLNVQVTVHGTPPAGGWLASNHLGYLDILALSSVRPVVFLAKSEIRGWPIFGMLAAFAGTLFIRRDKKADVTRFDEAFAQIVKEGAVLGIFPEGTSSDGTRVLPFHSSLFASAAAGDWPVTPAWIGYETDGGSAELDVCYWGDMTFPPHFFKLLTLRQIKATVAYGEPVPRGLDRKEMARQLHAQVCRMAERHRPAMARANAAPEPALAAPASR